METAATNQLRWFLAWFRESGETGLSYPINPPANDYVLIRERAGCYANGQWDPGYCDLLAWLGDQGIMLGAFREILESDLAQGINEQELSISMIYQHILAGVDQACWSSYGYANMPVSVLRPWVLYQQIPGGSYLPFPEEDDADYQTGVGVYCNYLLQAMQAGYQVPAETQKRILNLAAQIVLGAFDTQTQQIACDAFIPVESSDRRADRLTAYINRLAILTVASRFQKGNTE